MSYQLKPYQILYYCNFFIISNIIFNISNRKVREEINVLPGFWPVDSSEITLNLLPSPFLTALAYSLLPPILNYISILFILYLFLPYKYQSKHPNTFSINILF